ncbi:RNA 2',3'-cyclic phosphodiesterase, partial [Thermoanaerobacter thermohydrosulfuricus]
MRAFVGIDIGEKTIEQIVRFQETLKNYTVKGRWTYKDNFHITLKFLGEIEVEAISKIEDAVKVAVKG